MALGSGMAAQIGYGVESTPGTVVTPTIFVPLRSETLTDDRERLESEAIIAGRRVLDDDMWNGGNATVGGGVQHDLYDRGIGSLFKAMFGGVSTTGSGPYTHTFTPADLTDNSLTVQKGVPDLAGTVHPMTFAGSFVTSWEIAVAQGAIASLGLTFACMGSETGSRALADGVTTNADATVTSAGGAFTAADVGKSISGTGIPAGATIVTINSSTSVEISAAATADGTGVALVVGKALASASYASGAKPVKFNHGHVLIGGSAVNVKSATVAGDNGLATDRRYIGSKNIAAPKEAALRTYTGSLDVDFDDLTQYNRYLAGDTFALVLGFTVGTYSLTITQNSRYEPGQTPQVGGTGIVGQSLGYKSLGSTDAAAITAVLVNGDSTVA